MKAIIYPIEEAAPNRIAIVARPRGGDWLCDEISALSEEGIDVLVSMLTQDESNELGLSRELEECETTAINSLMSRFLTAARHRMETISCARLIGLRDMVKAGRFLGVHCRASIGRSSILAVSVLVRLGWNASKAFYAVELARGYPVPDTLEQRQWVVQNVPAIADES